MVISDIENLVSQNMEEGGLSGEPLQKISTTMIKKFYKQLNGIKERGPVKKCSSGKFKSGCNLKYLDL